jgi:Iron-containing redox enzyme
MLLPYPRPRRGNRRTSRAARAGRLISVGCGYRPNMLVIEHSNVAGSSEAPGAMLPRGPLSDRLMSVLAGRPGPQPELVDLARAMPDQTTDSPTDDDLQLSLYLLYELHYRGLAGVDERWEWHPDLVATAAFLEFAFEDDLRRLVAPALPAVPPTPAEVPIALARLVASDSGPSLSAYLSRRGTRSQYGEFLMHRSIYHLREADPHSWAIPRLSGAPKCALVEIQADEYGGGRPEWMHAGLFAASMRGLGLSDDYGHFAGAVPAVTLAWSNTMTMFGLHRRLRGAAAGHLAALEMTSSLPNRRYGNGLRRLGFGLDTTRFFDEHIEADAVHEQIAAHDLAGALARAEPDLVDDIMFGAAAALATDGLVARHMLDAWQDGRSSLRC